MSNQQPAQDSSAARRFSQRDRSNHKKSFAHVARAAVVLIQLSQLAESESERFVLGD